MADWSPGRRLAANSALLAVVAGVGLIGRALWPWERFTELVGIVALTFPLGRYVILLPATGSGFTFSAAEIALLAVAVDAALATAVALNFDLLHHLPWVGGGLASAQRRAAELLADRPRRKFWLEAAVAFLVTIPIPGSGPIGATLVARFAGLSPGRSVASVLLGSAAGAVAFVAFAPALASVVTPLKDSEWYATLRIVVIAVIAAALLCLGARSAAAERRR